ncbi:MAG: hypothetical protein ACFCVK_26120 [Acidimicrobiales bacterium]
MASLDWTAVGAGAVAGLVPLAIVGIVGSVAVDDDPSIAWSAAFLAVALATFTGAGVVAGHLRRDTPMAHGGAAAVVVAAVAQVVAIGTLRLDDRPVDWLLVPVALIVAAACGVAGALGSEWFGRRRQRASG